MQLCIVIVVVASLAAADLASPDEVVLGAPKLCGVLLSQCLVVVVAWAIACQTGVDATNDLISRHQAGLRLERRYKLHLGVWLVMSLCILTCFDWARMIANSNLAHQLLFNRVFLLLPLISPLILSWAVFYEAECLLDARLSSQSRWSYVVSQMRSFLFVPLVPVLFVTGCCDAFDHFAGDFAATQWAGLVGVIPLLLVLLAFPIMLRMLWRTKSLKNGPLRCQLERLSRRLGFSINDILVWQTQQRVLNAAVTGLVPRLRYVLLTDRLIRELPPEQIESIFLHEVAHAKLHHSLKLMATMSGMLASGCLFVFSATDAYGGAPNESPNGSVVLLLLAFMVFACLVVVGRYARLLELQADLWAANKMSDSPQYMRAIAAVAIGNPDQITWLHPSFRQRNDFLKQDEKAATWLRRRLQIATAISVVWSAGFFLAAAALNGS